MKNCVCILILCVLSVCGRVSASTGSAEVASEAATASDTLCLQEVTISAIKQNQLFREPVASTVIGEQLVEQQEIMTVKGMSDLVPNFFVPDYGSRMTSSIYVRGIGARIDQPAVALNVDNVPVMNKDAYDFDLPDIYSIEMLRGPQSTLYGRNSMGGAINISTLSPMRWQGVRLLAEYGSGNTWRVNASAYGKLSNRLAMSLSFGGAGTDGFFTNKYTGDKCDWEHGMSGRWKLEWIPKENVSVMNVFALSHTKQGGYPYEYIPTGEIAYNDTCSYKRLWLSDGLTVVHKLPGMTLSSITSWQYINDDMHLDQDFLPLDYFTLRQRRHENVFTEDVVLRSDNTGRYNWLAGAFAFYRYMDMDAPVDFHDDGIANLIELHRNQANPYYPVSWAERSFPLQSNFKYPSFGAALYHESELTLGRWRLSAGLRADLERPSLKYWSECHTAYNMYSRQPDGEYDFLRRVDVDISDSGSLHHCYFQLLPKFTALWTFSGLTQLNGNIYANIAKGYKAGGFNTQMFSDVLQQRLMNMMGIGSRYDVDKIVSYKPEKSWNFELGAHFSSIDARFGGEVSLFYIDCTDQQLTMFPDGTTTGRIMTNAGKTRSYGFELSATANPLSGLELRAGYGFTDARFRRFDNGKESFAGKFVPYAPRQTLFLSASYEHPLPSAFCRSVAVEVDGSGAGKIYWDEANTLSQNFYMLLGASLTLKNDYGSLQLWGRNLTDTNYHTFYFMSIGNQFVQRGRPLTVGLTLRVNLEKTKTI